MLMNNKTRKKISYTDPNSTKASIFKMKTITMNLKSYTNLAWQIVVVERNLHSSLI